MMSSRLDKSFFSQDALDLAPQLLGKICARRFSNGNLIRNIITEVEVYRGEEDLACHASKGRTARTEIMYAPGGVVYVYFIYGMHWLWNVVAGPKDHPQAVLIRGLQDVSGPGRVGRLLELDKTFYGEDLSESKRLWLEDSEKISSGKIITTPRIGIDYAKRWAKKPWRFVLK